MKEKADGHTRKSDKWILCRERLPKSGDIFLVTIRQVVNGAYVYWVGIARYSFDNTWDAIDGGYWPYDESCVVMAWQELPDPYEE